MKMDMVISVIFFALLCAGCKVDGGKEGETISLVASKAFRAVEADSVDFNQYSLKSIQMLRDGEMGTIDDSESDEYISSVRKKLRGKKYWEACYMVSADMVAGAKYCYYFKSDDLSYFATYSVK